MTVEAELLAAAADVLTRLGFVDFRIRLNHRGVLATMLDAGGVPRARHDEALVAVDKLDKIGPAGVAEQLVTRGIPADGAARLLEFFAEGTARPEASGESSVALLDRLAAFVGERGAAPIAELRAIVRLSAATSAGRRISVDPSLARGLSYYTGAIFEIAVSDLAGSLGGGGRYDNLVGMFSGADVPACGISLGLERILVVMAERGMFPPEVVSSPADVMVVQWFADRTDLYLRLAGDLRAAGLRVELYPEAPDQDGRKVGERQFKYASARKIPFVAVIGASELASDSVNVKNMESGEQRLVARSQASATILAAMAERRDPPQGSRPRR
jgi:histidyl-tRNA synthetase